MFSILKSKFEKLNLGQTIKHPIIEIMSSCPMKEISSKVNKVIPNPTIPIINIVL